MFCVAVLTTGRFLMAYKHSVEKLPVSFLVFWFSLQGFKWGISVYPSDVFFDYQNTELGSTSGDPITHPWTQIAIVAMVSSFMADVWLFSGISSDEEPMSSPDICSSILFLLFALLLQLFLLSNLPCCTSSLLLFAVCTIKELTELVTPSAARPLLVHPGILRYNSFFLIDTGFLNLVISGLRSSNITLLHLSAADFDKSFCLSFWF